MPHAHHSSWFVTFFRPLPHHGPEYFGKLALMFFAVLVFLGLLQAFPKQYRRTIIAVFTFLGGLYYLLEFFMPANKATGQNGLTPYQDLVTNITSVVGAFAIGLGVVSLMQLHMRNIARRRTGWGYSLVLVLAAIAMCVFTILNQNHGKVAVIPRIGAMAPITVHDCFNVLFTGGLNNLDAATFSMIAFFIASASYRAFRIRSAESTLLMISALIVMLASTTLGTALTNWLPHGGPVANLRIEHISEWLLTKVNAPAQRGVLFGMEIGALATSLRLWLSLERGAYFDAEV